MSVPSESPTARRVHRRLAAIFAADVAGYSRLMGSDEEGTLAAVTAHRTELWEPSIAEHHGRIFNTTGDGLLAEFASVVDAVRCAIAIQGRMRQRNGAQPDHRLIKLRIGINLGDVIVQDHDVYGDGVNVAARLQELADPGGICVSEAVHQQVRLRVDLAFQDLGPVQVKNIAEPVRPFRAILDSDAAPAAARVTKAPRLPDKPSIAVLPFVNLSSDPEQEYFSDGMTEDVITDLSKISGLFVIARNSSFTYKGKAVNVAEVGRELGVRYVLEGSVRKSGGRVRVTAQLIEAATGGHVWAERYDRKIDDVFAMQDEVTRQIVAALALHLKPGEADRVFERGTTNFEAYDLFLRGRELVWLHSRIECRSGQELLRRAIALDPQFGKAHAFLAFSHTHEFINRWVDDPAASLDDAHRLAQRAVELAPRDADCRWALSVILLWQGKHDTALAEVRECLALEPNSVLGLGQLGLVLTYAGHPAEAVEVFNQALRLDPHATGLYLHFLAHALFNLERFEEAEALLYRRIALNPNAESSHVLLAAIHGHLGRYEAARAAWQEALRVNPNYSFAHRRHILPFKTREDFERLARGLELAGLPTT